jgi:anaerobic selenocysteine-containing dehydrogenase
MTEKWRYEENGYTVTRSCAYSPPGCHPVGCGLKLYVKNGKLEKVEGDENHPVTQGRLCIRCLSLPEYVNHPQRITHPMKRIGERGENKWQQISWDEAYDIIVEKTKYFSEKYGPESIVVFGGTGKEGGPMVAHFAQRMLGTPNACYTQSGYACYIPRVACTTYVLGGIYPEVDYAGGLPGRYDDPAYKIPECIIVWGKDPLTSNGDGMFGHAIVDLMKRGTELIVIDPRVNWLATRAKYHLQVRPGTDTALALAMLHVIINEDLYDKEFVDQWCYGFDKFAERVQEYPPERAAEITGVSKEKIIAAARFYGKSRPASIAWGLATDQKANGTQMAHCIVALMAITGNIDVPGGILLGDATPLGDIWSDSSSGVGYKGLPQELLDKIVGLKEYPAYVGLVMNAQADLMLEAIETGKPYPIKMGFFSSTNLIAATCASDPQRWYRALKKLEFTFATTVFMEPTTQAFADLVLPLSSFAEHDSVVATHYGASPVTTGAVNKAVKVGDCKSDLEIMLELGRRIKPEYWPWDNMDDFITEFRLGGEMTFGELREKVVIQREVSYRKYKLGKLRADGQPGFDTPTGKIELYCTMFEKFGEDPLPYYEEPQYSPVTTPDLLKEYPLILTSGARSFAFFHSEQRQIRSLREVHPDPLIEIHPDTAASLGIIDGDWVSVENMFGKCKLKARVTPIVHPKVVHAQHGWWFPEKAAEEPTLYGVWESNINNLVPHKHIGKLGFGAPFKCLICKVSKLEPVFKKEEY